MNSSAIISPFVLRGIDTPEIRGKCQKEKDLAKEARDLVRGLLDNAQAITLTIDDNPKEVRGKGFSDCGEIDRRWCGYFGGTNSK